MTYCMNGKCTLGAEHKGSCKTVNEPDVLEVSEEDLWKEAEQLSKRIAGVSAMEGFALLKIGKMYHGTIFQARMSGIEWLLDSSFVEPTQEHYESALLKMRNKCIVLGEE